MTTRTIKAGGIAAGDVVHFDWSHKFRVDHRCKYPTSDKVSYCGDWLQPKKGEGRITMPADRDVEIEVGP